MYRLRNQAEPDRTLCLTGETWFNILDLAEVYGWNPLGRTTADQQNEAPLPQAGYFLGAPLFTYPQEMKQEGSQILAEDALSLADALELAFFEYEPLRVPDSFYLFQPADRSFESRPSLGAILETIQFCRLGAFQIEQRQFVQ
jgi:hypothetical protein